MPKQKRQVIWTDLTTQENFVLWKSSGTDKDEFLLFRHPVKIFRASNQKELFALLTELDKARRAGYYTAGCLNYEAIGPDYPAEDLQNRTTPNQSTLAWFGIYKKAETLSVAGELTPFNPEFTLFRENPKNNPNTSKERFFQDIHKIKHLLRNGDCYQINLTMEENFNFAGDPLALFLYLYAQQPSQFSAFIKTDERCIVSLSPELFFRTIHLTAERYRIETRPVKGTAPRGSTEESDRWNREYLRTNEKTVAENIMIADLLRNDLGRIATSGSVKAESLLSVEQLPTLNQMHSLIQADISSTCHSHLFERVMPALFPCASITGAPKRAAQKQIQDIEKRERGIYTGAIGYAGPLNRLQQEKQQQPGKEEGISSIFNVAIRTLEIDRNANRAKFGCGCGIVWDSNAEDEYNEYLLKQSFLLPALDGFSIIETMLLKNGKIYFWLRHRRRLEKTLKRFSIHIDSKILKQKLRGAISENSAESSRLRLTVDRKGEITLALTPADSCFQRPGLALKKVKVQMAGRSTYSGDPFRPWKTTERKIFDEEWNRVKALGYDDALFMNEKGEITESATSNVLIYTADRKWFSPSADSGLLQGVYLSYLEKLDPRRIGRKKMNLQDILEAKIVLLCNSVRGLRKIDILDQDKTAGESER